MRKASVLLVAIALALFGLAACGGDDDGNGDTTVAEETTTEAPAGDAGAATTLNLTSPADSSLEYDTDSLEAPAGSITIDYDNPASLPHDVVVEDASGEELGKTDLVSDGETSVTLDLQPGTYTFFCSVPGHRPSGMEGTLTVN